MAQGWAVHMLNVFVPIVEYICPNCELYLCKLKKVFVQITNRMYMYLGWHEDGQCEHLPARLTPLTPARLLKLLNCLRRSNLI